jgi:hypothetical protein
MKGIVMSDARNHEDEKELAKNELVLETIKCLRKGGPRIEKERRSDILFITGCTSTKSETSEKEAAYKRYIGKASQGMLNFFGTFHQKKKRLLDLYVLSAGYGFIPADSRIQKYDVSFNNVNAVLRGKMAQRLAVGEDFQDLLNLGYKLVILRLGSNYIKALKDVAQNGYNVLKNTKVCCLKTKSEKTCKKLLHSDDLKGIEVNETDQRINGGKIPYQDRIWSKFFEKNKDASTDEIIQKINNAKNVKELMK